MWKHWGKVLACAVCALLVVAGIWIGAMIAVTTPVWLSIVLMTASGALLSAGLAGVFYGISRDGKKKWSWVEFGKGRDALVYVDRVSLRIRQDQRDRKVFEEGR
jgi:zinc transporter ZupT